MEKTLLTNVRTLRCVINDRSNLQLNGNDIEMYDGYISIKCDTVQLLDGLLLFKDDKGVILQLIHSTNISIIDIIYKH